MPPSLSPEDAQEAHIVERIYEAVIDQRLAPGAKLSEASLCTAFGVGRMRIRRCLLILASREVVELQPNRGAYVAQPSAQQAREIFEARLAIEPSLARLAAARVKRVRIAICTAANANAGSRSDCTAGQAPASHPGNPPAGNQLSSTENSRISSSPSQKFGMARPSCVPMPMARPEQYKIIVRARVVAAVVQVL
jgi:DNA-binding transcriptional regulator YhcF (GntR family)